MVATYNFGSVYINNDQQAILSWRKHLKLLLWTIYFAVHQQNMYIQKRQKGKQQKKKKLKTGGVNSYSWCALRLFANHDFRLPLIDYDG